MSESISSSTSANDFDATTLTIDIDIVKAMSEQQQETTTTAAEGSPTAASVAPTEASTAAGSPVENDDNNDNATSSAGEATAEAMPPAQDQDAAQATATAVAASPAATMITAVTPDSSPSKPPATTTTAASPSPNSSPSSKPSSPSPPSNNNSSRPSSPSSPPHSSSSLRPPSPAAAPKPPKSALFSMWGEKTKGSAPLAPGVKPPPFQPNKSYAGKRWSPPKKQAEEKEDASTRRNTFSGSGSNTVKPTSVMYSSNASTRWTPPNSRGASPVTTTRATSPLRPAATPPSSSLSPSARYSKAKETISGSPPPMPTSTSMSPSSKPPLAPASPARAIASTSALSATSPARSSPFRNHNTGPPTVNDLEDELDQLRELKQQLQISSAINAGDAQSGDVSISVKGVEAQGGGIGTRRKSKKSAHMRSFWQQKTDGTKAPEGTRDFAPPRTGEATTGTATAAAITSMTSPVPTNFENTPAPNAEIAGGGMAKKVNGNSIRLPSPPMGKPPEGAAFGSPRAMNAPPSPTEDGALMEFRGLVEKLVAQVLPTEVDNIDELIEEYSGREAELLDTLTSMRENDELLSHVSGMSESELIDSLDESEGRTNKVIVDTSAMPAALPSILSQDEVQIYEASPSNKSDASRGSPSFDGDIHLGANHEDESQKSNKEAAAMAALTAAVGGTAAAAMMVNMDKKPSVSQHFKDVARADAAVGSPSFSEHSTSTQHTDNRRSTRKSLVPAQLGEEDTSKMSQCDTANSAVAAPTEAVPIASPNDIETGGNANDNAENKRKATEAQERKRKRTRMMVIILIVLLCAGIGAGLGIILVGQNKKDRDVSESNQDDGTEFDARSDKTPPIIGKVPTITKSPTPEPTTPFLGYYNDGYDADAPLTACNSIPREKIQELGVKSFPGDYPNVAVDGDAAVVASGTGPIAFYNLNPSTKQWERGEVFGILTNYGKIKSVAISGNVAVIGAPYASTDLSAELGGPLKTGAVFIYERTVKPDGGGYRWAQIKGAMVPTEYKFGKDKYHEARFGVSVDVDKDLIVVGASWENSNQGNNRGSVTVFKKDRDTSSWEQVKMLYPENLECDSGDSLFFGDSVQVYSDLIAASVDCKENIALYKFNRSDDTIKLSQKLPYINRQWGSVSSISMSYDHLVYSTSFGGLFFFVKSSKDETSQYLESKKLSFDFKNSLYNYPLTLDANMLVLSVANEIYVYTQDTNGEWKRESIVLESQGDFAGYIGAPVALSGGHLMVADQREVKNHDFTGCVRESEAPSSLPTSTPTSPPTESRIESKAPSSLPTSTPTSPTTESRIESKAPSPFPTPIPTTSPAITQGSPTCIDVNIIFDNYPSDTSWEIIDLSNGYVVDKSPIFDESLQDHSRRVCLADGNYAFTIADKYEDGMCCQWGQGSYSVTTDRNDVIVEGGEYGADERTTFTMPYDPENVETEPPSAKPTPTVPVTSPPVTTSAPTPLPTPKPTPLPTPNPTATPQPTPLPTPNPTEQVTSPPGDDTCYNLDVSVSLDQYPTDTRWEILPQGQIAAIATSNQYEASMLLGPAPLETVCLPDGMYDFIIYDVYGDGMCCDWGQGSYQLAFGDNVVASGGEFGQSEKVTFTTPAGSPTPPAECYDVFVNLILDRYPQDTSWDISQAGSVVAASPPFPADKTTDEQEFCLPSGDYVFTIYDVYSDGMCCKWGVGSYSLTTNNGEVISEGGEFEASESTEFSLPTAAI